MVDPTKGVSPYQGLISGTRVSEPVQNRRVTDTKDPSAPNDVNLNPKALNEAQAEDVSAKVRSLLESDQGLSLSRGSGFVESL
jgi:hypothetical protein